MKKVITASAVALGLTACATIIKGTSQEIAINTNPTGATCTLNREGAPIGKVDSTPGVAKVERTKHEITVVCNKAGYQEATYLARSGVEGSTFVNFALGGLGGPIGWAIDSANGADNHYRSPINVTLLPVTVSQTR